jgi:hypothetical protein
LGVPSTASAAATTTITSGPSGVSNVTFEFVSSDPTATFECRLDDGPPEPCASPKTYDGMEYQSHELRVYSDLLLDRRLDRELPLRARRRADRRVRPVAVARDRVDGVGGADREARS